MKRKRPNPRLGISLSEILVASLIASLIFIFLFRVMHSFNRGVTRIQRFVPMQRDLQMLKRQLEKDLLSAPRSSLGNVVPNPGFETVPAPVSATLPAPAGFWACPPYPLHVFPPQSAVGYISATANAVGNGLYGLRVNVTGSPGGAPSTYYAVSCPFTLTPGNSYLFGGAIVVNTSSVGGPGDLKLKNSFLGTVATLSSGGPNWTFVGGNSFVADPGDYTVEAGTTTVGHAVIGYDDITVTPLVSLLTPTNGETYLFSNVQLSDSNLVQRVKMRYRLTPFGNSGELRREKWDGSSWQLAGSIKNIRRLEIGWNFGGAAPGTFPPTPPPPVLFARGMNFPLEITVESGDVGATSEKSLSMTFSVFPAVP